MNKPLLISFSGGTTSAFMAKYLQERYPQREKVFVFANTGMEREETLEFIDECDRHWKLGVFWVQAVIKMDDLNDTIIVDFNTADRTGFTFSQMIKKYGLPNKSFPHCTRELKERPIKRFAIKALGWADYETAIGIRYDERHRISAKRRQAGFIYPLTDELKISKVIINEWWEKQPFRLQLKDYEGNCDFCWKKSRRKRLTLIADGLNIDRWEGWETVSDFTFDRDGYTIPQLREMASKNFHKVKDQREIVKSAPELFDNMDFEMECFCKST